MHFIRDAVRLLDVGQARVNERGMGSPQYPPTLMPGLLIDSYATGAFSSRQIERATYENVAVRLLCADRHPDHDSICTFRRTNGALLQSRFEQVLAMAAQMRVLNVGQVSLAIDGTYILAKAEAANRPPLEDGLILPVEIARRQEQLVALPLKLLIPPLSALPRAHPPATPCWIVFFQSET